MKTISVLWLALVCLGCGYSAPKSMPAQPGVVPAVAQLVPNTANSGDPQFTLTVNGSNFATNAVINWNGAKQTTMQVTSGQLTATIPAAAVASPAMVSVTVTNPGTPGTGGIYGGGGTASATSNAMPFTVN
jgi:IPT/TIG domain